MTEYPESISEEMRKELEFDELVFGNSYIEKTEDGWRRIDPIEIMEGER